MAFAWQKTPEESPHSTFLITGGAEILARSSNEIHIEAGSVVAIEGTDTFKKSFFVDWLMGFQEIGNSSVEFKLGETCIRSHEQRKSISMIIGRSAFTYGETVSEAVLYRTNGVRKEALYYFIERLYGSTLKARTNPANPLVDKNSKPIPTYILNSRELLEIAQINLMLQKPALVTLDFSSSFMHKALSEGFKPAPEIFESGKTVLVILPSGEQTVHSREELRARTEKMLGCKFTATIQV